MKIFSCYPNILKYLQNQDLVSATLISLVLIAIPFKHLYSNIALAFFILHFVFTTNKIKYLFRFSLLLPILLYSVMVLSLLWTTNFSATLNGLRKEILFLVLPIVFIFKPSFTAYIKNLLLRQFSFGMTIYAALCFICSSIKFYNTGNKNVFLFHELVTVEVNAIYIAVFATLALFYFVQLQNKKNIDFMAIYMLFIFLIFLSSKTVCFIGCFLGLWYYINCSKTSSGIKIVSAAISLTFIMFSFLYVDTIRNRFLEEYETAFVDNSLNNSLGSPENKVLNISLKQAWTKDKFNPNEFFPGTAFRIVHIRFFSEIIKTKKNIYLGLGQDASEKSIKQTYNQYKLFENYNYFNFHNQYIQIFAELGILGFFVFLYMIFFNIQQAMRHDDFLHLVFASSTAIIFLTESMLCRQRGIVFFIVLYCIFNTTAIEQKKLEI